MQSTAALLLVTLIGASITSALCALTCVHHEHHSAQAASAQTCHERGSLNGGPLVTSGTAAVCHDQVETLTATAADARLLKAARTAVQFPAALAVYHSQLPVVTRKTSFGLPGFVLPTTLLRI